MGTQFKQTNKQTNKPLTSTAVGQERIMPVPVACIWAKL